MKKLLNLIIIVAVINVAIAGELNGNNVLTMAANRRLEAKIAANTINRLAVVNDRILNVFGEEDTFTMQTDERTGQVFIKPLNNSGQELFITLITENGITQDLTLIPSLSQAATIILKPAVNNVSLPPIHMPRKERSLELIKQAVLGQLPLTKHKPKARHAAGLELKFSKCYQAGELLVNVWQVKNISKTTQQLQEAQFFNKGDLALSLQHRLLPEKAITLLYILEHHAREH